MAAIERSKIQKIEQKDSSIVLYTDYCEKHYRNKVINEFLKTQFERQDLELKVMLQELHYPEYTFTKLYSDNRYMPYYSKGAAKIEAYTLEELTHYPTYVSIGINLDTTEYKYKLYKFILSNGLEGSMTLKKNERVNSMYVGKEVEYEWKSNMKRKMVGKEEYINFYPTIKLPEDVFKNK